MLSFLRTSLIASAVGFLLLLSGAPAFAQQAPAQTAPSANIQLSQPINGRSSVTGINDYIRNAYRYLLGIVTTVAIVMITYGGFRYLIGSTSGDINKGKEIIQNAIAGMLLVFGAYLILQTVNPQTLTLKVPALTQITPQALQAPISTCVARNVVVDSPACGRDADCGTGGGFCMRFNYFDNASNISQGGLYASQPEVRTTRTGGQCSVGAEGQRCRCAGFGCRLTRSYANSDTQYGADLRGQSGIDLGDFTPSQTALRADAPLTNNSGQGWVNCSSGLSCVFLDNRSGSGNASNGWYCARTPARTGSRPGSVSPRNCVRDQDCGSDVCLRTDPEAGVNFGECAPRTNAPVGTRCACSKFGCGSRPYNQNGTTLTTNNVTCAQGLVCALFNYSSDNSAAPPNGNWFCAPSVTEDAQSLSAACQAAAQPAGGTGAVSGSCAYSCQPGGGGAATTPSVSVPCTGATQAAADSVCSTACASGANSCSTRVPGSTCVNPRCVPTVR